MQSNFKEIDLDVHYDTENNNIATDFYNKVFEATVEYKRAVAYFDSVSLLIVLDGIKELVKNNSKIYFLISPKISEKDIEAIQKGYQSREEIVEDILIKDFESASGDQYNLLAWLIHKEILDIKVVFRAGEGPGIFHEKLGLIKDVHDNAICFHGTNNDTYSAHMNNFESFDVFISWDYRDSLRIKKKEASFDQFWESGGDQWDSFYITDKIKQKILEFRDNEDPFAVESKFLLEEKEKKNYPCEPGWLELRKYQSDAINEWFQHGGRGIFEMATGERVIIVTGCINVLVSRVSGTLTKYNSCIA